MANEKSISFLTQPITLESELEISQWPVNYDRPMVIYHITAKSAK